MAARKQSPVVDLAEVNAALAAAQGTPVDEFDAALGMWTAEDRVWITRFRETRGMRNADGTVNVVPKSELPIFITPSGKIPVFPDRIQARMASDRLRARSFTSIYWPSLAPKSTVESQGEIQEVRFPNEQVKVWIGNLDPKTRAQFTREELAVYMS